MKLAGLPAVTTELVMLTPGFFILRVIQSDLLRATDMNKQNLPRHSCIAFLVLALIIAYVPLEIA
jgi:hypothetical protein